MTGPQQSSVPPSPSPSEDDLVDRLCLLRSRRVGIATYRRLLSEHGSAKAALTALPELARNAGVADYQSCPREVVLGELRLGRKSGAQLVAEGMTAYPDTLTEIPDAPPFFWAMGDVTLLQRPAIAIVGARNASSLGQRMAKRLARQLAAEGYAIVSGLARGIDRAAHEGALADGTIAVQAGGVDTVYPAENAELSTAIGQQGLRISEMSMGMTPQARHFPARNRIISGIARAVVVVEAAAKSGSLITAANALDYGRDVMAVPGHPFDARAWGCNTLIRDGATLVRDADDVLEVIGPATSPAVVSPPPTATATPNRSLRDTAKLHRMILDRISPAPISEDQLVRDVSATATDIAPILVDLELEGRIIRSAGGMVARNG
jgi:DNA processing protein